MSEVFADTAYFIAHLNRADQYHRQAVEMSDRLEARVITSDWVTLEVADGFANTRHRSLVQPLVARWRNSSLSEIVRVSASLLDEALILYPRYQDKDWTLTDCTSLLVMRKRGITEALTGDRHFEQAGFIAMLK